MHYTALTLDKVIDFLICKTKMSIVSSFFCICAGLYEVGVHIADVSYFVENDTELDAEARRRATSVYLVQKVCSKHEMTK